MRSLRDPIFVDAVMIHCFDPRFAKAIDAFKEHLGMIIDPVVIPGGARNLGRSAKPHEQAATLKGIEIAVNKHRAGRVILVSHSDCLDYGGLMGGFGGCCETERMELIADLRHGASTIRPLYSEVEVRGYVVDFYGFDEIDV